MVRPPGSVNPAAGPARSSHCDTPGMPWIMASMTSRALPLAASSPELLPNAFIPEWYRRQNAPVSRGVSAGQEPIR